MRASRRTCLVLVLRDRIGGRRPDLLLSFFCTIIAKPPFQRKAIPIRASDPNTIPMATRRKHLILTQPEREGKAVKVRLDSRTVVLVKNAKALASWKQRYPKAEVIKD